MSTGGSRRLDRRETNPAFSSRKLKLGTFQTNLDSGCVMSDLEGRLDIRHGDLFGPVAGERFDLVLFNPPFYLGVPKDDRDAAWRSNDVAQRFAAGLGDHLAPAGVALVLLSSFGDACALFESELRANGFQLDVFARRRFINETLTILRATRGPAPAQELS